MYLHLNSKILYHVVRVTPSSQVKLGKGAHTIFDLTKKGENLIVLMELARKSRHKKSNIMACWSSSVF